MEFIINSKMLNSKMNVSKVRFQNKRCNGYLNPFFRIKSHVLNREMGGALFKMKSAFFGGPHFMGGGMQQASNLKIGKKLLIGFPMCCFTKKSVFFEKKLSFRYCKKLSLQYGLFCWKKLLSSNIYSPRLKSFSLTSSVSLFNSHSKKSSPEHFLKKIDNSNSQFDCNYNFKYKNKLYIHSLQSISCEDKNISPDWHFKPNIVSSNNSQSLKEESIPLMKRNGLIKNAVFKKNKTTNHDFFIRRAPALWFSSGYLSWSTLFSTRKYWWSRLPSTLLMQRLTYKTFLIPYNFLRNKGSNINKETENLNRNNLPEWLMEKQLYWYWVLPFFGCLGLSVLSSNQTALRNDMSFLHIKTKDLETSNSFLKEDILFENFISWETLHYLDYKRSLFDTSKKYIKNINYYHDTLRVTLESRWFNQQKEEYNCTFSDQNLNKDAIGPEKVYFDIWESSLKNLKTSLLNEFTSKTKLQLTNTKNETIKNLETSKQNPNNSFSVLTKDTEQEFFLEGIAWQNRIRSQSSFYWYWHNFKSEPLFHFVNNDNTNIKNSEQNWIFMDEFAQKISPDYLFSNFKKESVAKTSLLSKSNNQNKRDIQVFNNILYDVYKQKPNVIVLKKNSVNVKKDHAFKTKFSVLKMSYNYNKVLTRSSFQKEFDLIKETKFEPNGGGYSKKLIGIYYTGKKYVSNFIQNSQKNKDLINKINNNNNGLPFLFNNTKSSNLSYKKNSPIPLKKEKKIITSKIWRKNRPVFSPSFLLWTEWLNSNLKIYKSIGKEFIETDFHLLKNLQNSRFHKDSFAKRPINSFQKAHVFYNNILNTLWLESNHNIYNSNFMMDGYWGKNRTPQPQLGPFITSGHLFPEYDIYDLLKFKKEAIRIMTSNFLTNNSNERQNGEGIKTSFSSRFCQPFLKFNVINVTKMPPNALKLYAQDMQTVINYKNQSLNSNNIEIKDKKDLRQSLVRPYTSLEKENFDLLWFEIKNRIKKKNIVRSSLNQQRFLGGSLLNVNQTSNFLKKERASFLIKKNTAVLKTPPFLKKDVIPFKRDAFNKQVLIPGFSSYKQSDKNVLNGLLSLKKKNTVLNFKKTYINNWSLFHKYFTNYYGTNGGEKTGMFFPPLLNPFNEFDLVNSQTLKIGPEKWLKKQKINLDFSLGQNLLLPQENLVLKKWHSKRKAGFFYKTINKMNFISNKIVQKPTLELLWEQRANSKLKGFQALQTTKYYQGKTARQNNNTQTNKNTENDNSNKTLNKIVRILLKRRRYRKVVSFDKLCHWLRDTLYFRKMTSQIQLSKNYFNRFSSKYGEKTGLFSPPPFSEQLSDLAFKEKRNFFVLNNNDMTNASLKSLVMNKMGKKQACFFPALHKKRKIRSFRPFYESFSPGPSLVKKTKNVKNKKLLLSFSNELYNFAKQFQLTNLNYPLKTIRNFFYDSNFIRKENDYSANLLNSKKLLPNQDNLNFINSYYTSKFIHYKPITFHSFLQYDNVSFSGLTNKNNKSLNKMGKKQACFFPALKSVSKPKYKINSYISSTIVAGNESYLFSSIDYLNNKKDFRNKMEASYHNNNNTANMNLFLTNNSFLFNNINRNFSALMKTVVNIISNYSNNTYLFLNNILSKINNFITSLGAALKMPSSLISGNMSNFSPEKDSNIKVSLLTLFPNSNNNSLYQNYCLKTQNVFLNFKQKQNRFKKRSDFKTISSQKWGQNRSFIMGPPSFLQDLRKDTKWSNNIKQNWETQINPSFLFLNKTSSFDFKKDIKTATSIFEKNNSLPLNNQNHSIYKRRWNLVVQNELTTPLLVQFKNLSSMFSIWRERFKISNSSDYTLLLNLVYFDHLGAVLNNIFKEFLLSNLSLLKEINGFKGSVHFNLQKTNTSSSTALQKKSIYLLSDDSCSHFWYNLSLSKEKAFVSPNWSFNILNHLKQNHPSVYNIIQKRNAKKTVFNESLTSMPNAFLNKNTEENEKWVHDLLRNFTKTTKSLLTNGGGKNMPVFSPYLKSSIAYNNVVPDKELTNMNSFVEINKNVDALLLNNNELTTSRIKKTSFSLRNEQPNIVLKSLMSNSQITSNNLLLSPNYVSLINKNLIRNKFKKSFLNYNDSAVLSKNFIIKKRTNKSKKLYLMKRQQKFLRILQMIKRTRFLYENKVISPLLNKLLQTSPKKSDTFNISKEQESLNIMNRDNSNKTFVKTLVPSVTNLSLENLQTETWEPYFNKVKPIQTASLKSETKVSQKNNKVKNTIKFRRKEGILISRTPTKVKEAATAKTQKYSLCIKDLSSFLFFQNQTSALAGTGFWMCAILFHICIVFSLITIYKAAFHFCIKCTFTLTTLLLKHFINLKRSFQRINKYVYQNSIKFLIDAVNQNIIISKDKNILSKFQFYLTSFLLVKNKPLTVNKREFLFGSKTGNLLLNLFLIKRNTNIRKTASSFLNLNKNWDFKNILFNKSLKIFGNKNVLGSFLDQRGGGKNVFTPFKKEENENLFAKMGGKKQACFFTNSSKVSQKKDQQNQSIKMNVKLFKLDFLILLLIGESQVLAELEPYREMHWYFLKKQPLIMRAPATQLLEDPINMYDYQADEKIRKLKIRLRKSAEILSGKMDKTTKKYKSISEFKIGPVQKDESQGNKKSLINSRKEKEKNDLIKKMYSRALFPSLQNNQYFVKNEVTLHKAQNVLRKNKRLQNLQVWKGGKTGMFFPFPLFSFFGKTLLISRLIKFNQTFRQSLFFFDQPLSIFGPVGTLFGPYLIKQFGMTFDTNRNKPLLIDLFFKDQHKSKNGVFFDHVNMRSDVFFKIQNPFGPSFFAGFSNKEKTLRTDDLQKNELNTNFSNLELEKFNSNFFKSNDYLEPKNKDSIKLLEKNGDWTQFLSLQILNRLSASKKLRIFTSVPPISFKKEDRDMSNHLSKLVNKYSLIKKNYQNTRFNFKKDLNSGSLKPDNIQKQNFLNTQGKRNTISLEILKMQQPQESTFLLNHDFSSIYQINTENSVSNMFLTSDTYDPKTRFYRFFTNFNKKLRHVRGLSYDYDVHNQLGPLMCQIYSGMFLNKNKTLKNILLVGRQGLLQKDTSSMLVQAMAGETGFKFFMEDSKRLGRVGRRGINKSIQRLFKLFQIAQSNVPCIVYLEDIHVIASKRRFVLFKDEHDDEDLAMRALFSKLIYQKEHIKKSLTTSFINQNLFFGGETPNRKRAVRPQNPIPKNFIQYQLNRRSAYSNYMSQNTGGQRKLNTTIFVSKRLAPSFTTNAVLIWKMFKNKIATPRKRVKEAPWTHLPIDALRSIHPLTYSVKVKVAKLSLLAIYTMGTQLRLVKDLIRLFESLKYDSYQGFIVFATTNKLSLIDPSLRQPGRLEETVYLSPSLFSTSVIGRIDVLNTYANNFTGFKNTFNIVNSALMLSSFPFANNGQNNNSNNSGMFKSSIIKGVDDEWNFVNSTAKKTYEKTYLANYFELKPQVYYNPKMDVVLNSPSSSYQIQRNKSMTDTLISSASQKQQNSVQKVLTLLNMSNQILSNISYRINRPIKVENTSTLSTVEKKKRNLSVNIKNFSNLSFITTSAYAQSGKFILSFVFEQILLSKKDPRNNKFQNKSFIYDIQNINGLNLWSFSNSTSELKQSNKFLQRSKYLKTQLARFIAPKIGELFVFSLPKRENTNNRAVIPFIKSTTSSLLNNKHATIQHLDLNSRKSPEFFKKGFVNVQGLTANGKTTSSFLLSLMLTNNFSGKNTFLPRLFRFEDVLKQRERPFSENLNSAILYEYLNINGGGKTGLFFPQPSFLNKNTISLEENLQNQQQQKYLLNLEKRPLRKYNLLKTADTSKSFKTNSLMTNFSNGENSAAVLKGKSAPNYFHMLFNELSSLDEISGRPTSLIYSSGSYYYNRKIMLKQKINKFSYKWWNWHLKKPTEFLEEYQYLDYFPYADKHYNPRHRRWTLSNGYWGYWFTYEKMYSYEIYEQWMVESFHTLSNKLDNYRELMDFLAQVLITKQVLSEVLFINIMKRFL
jgi:hypothetical protein